MAMLTIIFETHATSLDNENGVASGHRDVALSPLGERQARELGARYRQDLPDRVFCSDLQRSYQTAGIAFAGTGVAVVRDARLRECDYGEYTGAPSEMVAIERVQRIERPFPGGESYQQVMRRMQEFLNWLGENCAGQRVLIVGHRATQHALEHWLAGKAIEQVLSEDWQWRPGWLYEA